MVLKETDYNNYIVMIEKYLETIRFQWWVGCWNKYKKTNSVLQNSVSATKNHQL